MDLCPCRTPGRAARHGLRRTSRTVAGGLHVLVEFPEPRGERAPACSVVLPRIDGPPGVIAHRVAAVPGTVGAGSEGRVGRWRYRVARERLVASTISLMLLPVE